MLERGVCGSKGTDVLTARAAASSRSTLNGREKASLCTVAVLTGPAMSGLLQDDCHSLGHSHVHLCCPSHNGVMDSSPQPHAL